MDPQPQIRNMTVDRASLHRPQRQIGGVSVERLLHVDRASPWNPAADPLSLSPLSPRHSRTVGCPPQNLELSDVSTYLIGSFSLPLSQNNCLFRVGVSVSLYQVFVGSLPYM